MKTAKGHIKCLELMILGIFLLMVGVKVALFWNINQQEAKMSGQFAFVGGRPVIIKNGYVYEYGADDKWRNLELQGEAKQIVRGEILCVLNTDGSLYYGEEIDLKEEVLPLTSAYRLYMANMALTLNEEEPFVCINQNLDYLNFRGLLKNGDIFYQGAEKYERYHMENETPIFLSGSYILTTQGNVYYLNTDIDDYSRMTNTELKCVYDGQDIVAISASETSERCIGMRKNGKVISWSEIGPLEVMDWKNVVAIEQGFNYVVGLTDTGRILYADYNSKRTEAVTKALKQWTDVDQIATYSNNIVGLKNDDSCYFLDLTEYK